MSQNFGSNTSPVHAVGYRPEIDGLRALAVVAVVLFHAQLTCPGGYVGVDVFFVISGYLITSLLLRDLRGGRFSLVDFWERRLRRILPALMLMLMVTVGVGYFLLLPSDYEHVGKSVMASALMVANVFFWRDDSHRGGYFGPTSEERPLLHTWSLSVEEQFYILFPLVLYGLFRFERFRKPAVLTLILGAAVIACLGVAMYGVASRPGATFYLLPTRAWELLAGAWLASLSTTALPRHRWWRESAAWVGLTGIFLACWLYTKSTPFPGLAAVLPCAGAVLFIWGNSPVPGVSVGLTYAGRMLAWRPMVLIGLLSYSLYLWHWPVLVIGKYWWVHGTVPWYLNTGLVLLAVGLAVLSWRFVETPFRRKQLFSSRSAIFCLTGVCTGLFLALGGILVSYQGGVARLPEAALKNHEAKEDRFNLFYPETRLEDVKNVNFIPLGTSAHVISPHLFLWGDSHAGCAIAAIDALCREMKIEGYASVSYNNPPILGVVVPDSNPSIDTPQFNDEVMNYILKNSISHVILAGYWGRYQKIKPHILERGLSDTILRLYDAGCQVWVFQDVPDLDLAPHKQLSYKSMIGGTSGDWWRRSVKDHRLTNSVLYKLAEDGLPATFLDLATLLIDGSSDRYRADINGVSIYIDDDHLTQTASVALLLPFFREAMTEKLMAVPRSEPAGEK